MPTTQTFERQSTNVETWEKLKSHIMKQREKRKQEQEQDAEQERHRREQELKRKLDATTLEDIKDQLGKLETNLSELKKQKHELFLQLKKVLNEDEMRKKQSESEMLAARHALLAQSQNNQHSQYNQYLINANNAVVSSRLPASNAQSQQQMSQVVTLQQQQQLLPRHSPITTMTNLPSQPNFINTVITQSLPPAHQQTQQPQQLTNKQRSTINTTGLKGLKRPLDRSSSPQQAAPYNGVLPNYKTPSMAYTPTVSKISTTSHQAFFQPNRHLSIPVSQPFDAKNPYHYLTSGLQPNNDSTASLASLSHAEQHPSVMNQNHQLNAQQLQQFQQQQELIYQQQQLMKNMVNMQSSSLMSIQNAPMKGSITGGYPIQRPPNQSSAPNPNARFPGPRYMY